MYQSIPKKMGFYTKLKINVTAVTIFNYKNERSQGE
jgi:hypothetical protein